MTARHEEPATVEQLAPAMDAFGFYTGTNDPGEHAASALRVHLDRFGQDGLAAAYRQQLVTAGVEEDPDKLVELLRWHVLRAWMLLREIAQRPEAGPIPFAAAHAAEGLQWLLAVVAGGQQPTAAAVDALVHDIEAPRSSLLDAVASVDVLRRMLALADDLVRER